MFFSRFPLWSAQLSSWPGRHMLWCLCGQPGASTCPAQPASWRVSSPSLPASTIRSFTSAWAPSSARMFLCCCRARESAGRWCICSVSKISNPSRTRRIHLNHFLSKSRKRNTLWTSWSRPITRATRGSTASRRPLRLTTGRPSTMTAPRTLKHQSTGATGSEGHTWIFEDTGEIEDIFCVFWSHPYLWIVQITIIIKLFSESWVTLDAASFLAYLLYRFCLFSYCMHLL